MVIGLKNDEILMHNLIIVPIKLEYACLKNTYYINLEIWNFTSHEILFSIEARKNNPSIHNFLENT